MIVILTELARYSFCWSITCVGNFINHFAGVITKAIPLLAALLATFVADRHIAYTSKNRDHDQAFEVTQITHRYIAIAKDLRDKAKYLKEMLTNGGHPTQAFLIIIESIEKRYESLFEKDAYKYLDGKTVDKINSMSANVFCLVTLGSSLQESPAAKSSLLIQPLPTPKNIDLLLEDVDSLLKDLVELKEKTMRDL